MGQQAEHRTKSGGRVYRIRPRGDTEEESAGLAEHEGFRCLIQGVRPLDAVCVERGEAVLLQASDFLFWVPSRH